jgi:hypothetical protein
MDTLRITFEANRDLFAVVFDQLSELKRRDFEGDFEPLLPAHMLEGACQSTPALLRRQDFYEARETLCTPLQQHWCNPEIYPHLLSLQNCSDERVIDHHLRRLLVHLNLRLPNPSLFRNSKEMLRLRTPMPLVCRLSGNRLVEIPDVCHRARAGNLVVYCPYPGLFADVAGGLYHAQGHGYGPVSLANKVYAEIDELVRYSAQLHAGVVRRLRTIAFTGDDPAVTRSFSLKISYLGGIFSSICTSSSLMENIIHEYYHCRIRTWWLMEPLKDLPSDDQTLSSPVTREKRPVSVMLQALLIYVSLIHFHEWYATHGRNDAGRIWSRERAALLKKSTRSLIEVLTSVTLNRKACRAFVSALTEIFRGNCT